jgi:hypothetical protein
VNPPAPTVASTSAAANAARLHPPDTPCSLTRSRAAFGPFHDIDGHLTD